MPTGTIEDQIKMLIELQELDKEIFDKKRRIKEIPERVSELAAELESKTSNLKALEEESKKIQLAKKEKDGELEAKEQHVKKLQNQLFQLKTNKEYTAMQGEIASAKADSSIFEEEIIKLLDEIDEIQKKVAKEKEVFAGEKRKIDEEKSRVEAEKKKEETELAELEGKRGAFTDKIDKKILSTYERILVNRDGLALVPVIDELSCGGCGMNLPAQVVNEAKMKKKLILCGNCARVLYSN